MTCENYQVLLLDGDGVNDENRACLETHLSDCAQCRKFAAALQHIDEQLTGCLSAIDASANLPASVYSRIRLEELQRKPSVLPEIFDAIGWLAFAAAAILFVWWLTPLHALTLTWAAVQMPALFCVLTITTIAAIWSSVQLNAELKE